MEIYQKDRGYTLLEMMIIIVVISTLLIIAATVYFKVLARANEIACLANQKTIEIVRVYNYENNGTFGEDMSSLEPVFLGIGLLGDSKIDDITCPKGGIYTFDSNESEINCSIEEHNR